MHEPVIQHLEEYLHDGGRVAEVEAHLSKCDECRRELDAMRLQSALFRALRAPQELEPPPNFYTKVMGRVESQTRPSVWGLFGESLFAKRLAYASATFLMLLGTVLATSTQEEDMAAYTTPELILAGEVQPEPVSMDPQKDRDVILVKLATYQDYQ
jgi:anti-sigma factor RsiW